MESLTGMPAAPLGARPGMAEGRPLAPVLSQQVAGLLRMLEATLHTYAVMHSLHYQAMKVPELAALPSMERFTRCSLESLHARIAAIGFLRRIAFGDITPDVWQALHENIRLLNDGMTRMHESLDELAARPGAAESPILRTMSQIMVQAVQAHRSLMVQVQATLGFGLAPSPSC